MLYLGGSGHAVRSIDYPLPSAYTLAFDVSNRLAFEVYSKALQDSARRAEKSGRYPQ